MTTHTHMRPQRTFIPKEYFLHIFNPPTINIHSLILHTTWKPTSYLKRQSRQLLVIMLHIHFHVSRWINARANLQFIPRTTQFQTKRCPLSRRTYFPSSFPEPSNKDFPPRCNVSSSRVDVRSSHFAESFWSSICRW